MADSKDTVYIDIDDEITGIIDKVRGSSGKVVALVLPKRAAVFQSIVNMKLLKRAADDSKKNLVLITSEAGLMPLAGAAGIHVAKTLSSKPEIPLAPSQVDAAEEEAIDEGGVPEEVTKDTAGSQPVGQLAGMPPSDNGVETLELDDDEPPEDKGPASAAKKAAPVAGAAAAAKAAKSKAKQGGSKFKIPNFGKFRTKLLIAGGALLLLILFIIFGLIVLPKATISIKTDASNVPVNLDLNLSTTETQLSTDSDTPTVPAKTATIQKTYSQQVPTTGQKNNGSKASGTVTITATECSTQAPDDIPAGTGLSANGQTYITQDATSFSSNGNNNHHGCLVYNATGQTPISAQSGGSSSNTPGGTSFSVAGRSDVNASGSASGGSDNIVQIVNQNDINNAKAKIATNDSAQKQSLQQQLKGEGQFPITSTFNPGTPNVTQSAPVGAVANNVTVTEVVTYMMFGVKEKDLDTLVNNAVKDQVDTSKQTILSQGLNNASFSVNSSTPNSAQLTMQTTAEVGPDLNVAGIKQQSLGKKPADVKASLQNNPDVTGVDVKLSPFWVGSVPKKASKVTVQIAKPATTKSSSNANNP